MIFCWSGSVANSMNASDPAGFFEYAEMPRL